MILLWKKLLKTLDNTHTGSIIQVAIHFLIVLHNKFKEYILAAETLTPELEWLRDFQEEI